MDVLLEARKGRDGKYERLREKKLKYIIRSLRNQVAVSSALKRLSTMQTLLSDSRFNLEIILQETYAEWTTAVQEYVEPALPLNPLPIKTSRLEAKMIEAEQPINQLMQSIAMIKSNLLVKKMSVAGQVSVPITKPSKPSTSNPFPTLSFSKFAFPTLQRMPSAARSTNSGGSKDAKRDLEKGKDSLKPVVEEITSLSNIPLILSSSQSSADIATLHSNLNIEPLNETGSSLESMVTDLDSEAQAPKSSSIPKPAESAQLLTSSNLPKSAKITPIPVQVTDTPTLTESIEIAPIIPDLNSFQNDFDLNLIKKVGASEVEQALDPGEAENINEISMELDIPPGPTLIPEEIVQTIGKLISKTQVLDNVYQGSATSFLPSAHQSFKDISENGKTAYSFIPSVKEPVKAKPVIQALKAAENAAKKERETKEKKILEKEARKLHIAEKKELAKILPSGGIKRPLQLIADQGIKKKAAIVAHTSKLHSKLVAPPVISKPLLPISKPKLPIPSSIRLPIPTQVAIKTPFLQFHEQMETTPATPGLISLVDNDGGIIGMEDSNSSSDTDSFSDAKKKIPKISWASTPNLKQTLGSQTRINPDDIFMNVDRPNLKDILGGKNRNSSMGGHAERMTDLSSRERAEYKKAMGFE